MPEKPKRLGRGLDAILDQLSGPQDEESSATLLAPGDIKPNPFQPRKDFDSEKARQAFNDLKASIRAKGLVQPITVRKTDDGYEVIAGERRLRACQALGLEKIPVHVLQVENDVDMMELALIENLQRDNLNPLEEAEAFLLLADKYELSHEEIAVNIGKSRAAVTNALRLLKLPQEIKIALKNLVISAGHARALLGLDSEKAMVNAFEQIKRQAMSVRETEQFVKQIQSKGQKAPRAVKNTPKSVFIRKSEEALMGLLGTRVNIKAGPKKGLIQVEYFGDEDLERLLELFDSLKS